jgi:ABC-2 type transport system permease protein
MNILNSYRLMIRNVRVNTDPGTLVFLVLMPTIYLVFMGYMFGTLISQIPVGTTSINYKEFLSPGIAAFETATAGIVAGGLLWSDRRYGMFEQILSSPYTRAEYLFGILLTTLVFGFIGSGIMMLVSEAFLDYTAISLMGLGLIVVSISLGSLFFGCMFLAIAAKVKSNQAYNSLTILIIFLVDFASTVFYPITSATPEALKILFYVNPLTYIADVVRAGYISTVTTTNFVELLVSLIETIVMVAIAVLLYRKVRVGVT